jgi:ribokinase
MTNQPAAKIYLLGDINIDLSMMIDRYPVCGYEAFSHQTSTHIGGSVTNTAIVLAKMGLMPGLIGCIGKDPWGRHVLDNLCALDIDISQVHQKEGASTGISFIAVTPDGERTMFASRGANKLLNRDDISLLTLGNVSILHISGYALTESTQNEAAWRLVEIAEQSGVPISLDTGFAPVIAHTSQFQTLLESLTICILGVRELTALSGISEINKGVEWILSRGIKLLALKMGVNGSLLATPGEVIPFPAFPVNAVDTTGAGDAFSAGILIGFLHHLDLYSTGIIANALGALAVTVQGAGEMLPGKVEFNNFMQRAKTEGIHQPVPDGIQSLMDHLA